MLRLNTLWLRWAQTTSESCSQPSPISIRLEPTMDNKQFNMSKQDSTQSIFQDGRLPPAPTPVWKLILTRVYMLWTLFLTLCVVLIMLSVDKTKSAYQKVARAFRSHLSSLMQKRALEAYSTLTNLHEISLRQEPPQSTLKTNLPQKRSAGTWEARFSSLPVKLFVISMPHVLLVMLLILAL